MYNRIILVGNLTRDIEIKYLKNGTAVASTGIATSRKFTSNGEKKEEVCFVDLSFFGRSAEVVNQYCRKGSKVLIEGRLKLDQWEDQNGQKRSKHGAIVESMQMLDTKQHNEQQQAPQQQQSHTDYQPQQQPAPQQQAQQTLPDMDNEVPF